MPGAGVLPNELNCFVTVCFHSKLESSPLVTGTDNSEQERNRQPASICTPQRETILLQRAITDRDDKHKCMHNWMFIYWLKYMHYMALYMQASPMDKDSSLHSIIVMQHKWQSFCSIRVCVYCSSHVYWVLLVCVRIGFIYHLVSVTNSTSVWVNQKPCHKSDKTQQTSNNNLAGSSYDNSIQ